MVTSTIDGNCICVAVSGQIMRYDTDSVLSEKGFTTIIPIEFERGQIYLHLDFNEIRYRFKLDAGASQGVLYDDVILKGVKDMHLGLFTITKCSY